MKKILFTIALSSLIATNAFAYQYSDNCTNLEEATMDDSIVLSGCWLGDPDGMSIDKIIAYANARPNITRFSLESTGLHDADVKKLMGLQYVKELSLSSNRLTDESAKLIGNNNAIIYIELNSNNITDAGVAELVKNKNLQVIGLSRTRITDKSAILLAQSSAPWIDVEYNNLGDASAIALAQHSNLQQLHMSDNNVGDEGAKAFARAKFVLPENVPYILIDLDYNKIGAEGIAAMDANKQISVDTGNNPGSSQQDNKRKATSNTMNRK